jgi:sigma-54-interacting transcriptional regulator
MNRQNDSPRTPEDAAKALEDDITLAAMSLAPVLITAPPDDALRIVRAIAARERRGRVREVLTCDAAAGDDVIGAIAANRARIATDHGTAILWVSEVHALKSRDQFALMKLLAYPNTGRGGDVPRIAASSSLALSGCIAEGRFDARLFYRLNVIHIVVPTWASLRAVSAC